ncbi:Stationary phase inducible protein CsiE [Yersinia ruckeri ATCC 29473]|nr:Stationary phase inducible protein CsiE [Yersinia ruckeri ATCC 29473]
MQLTLINSIGMDIQMVETLDFAGYLSYILPGSWKPNAI